jgi:hypothetical protein
VPLPPPDLAGPALLQRDEIRAAVWGVERFVSEDETRDIDLDRTVAATVHLESLRLLGIHIAAEDSIDPFLIPLPLGFEPG